MEPHCRTHPAAAACCALLLALTGCSGPGAEPPEVLELPLDAFLEEMAGYRDPPAVEWTRIEELTAQCMTEQGFQYTPSPVPEGLAGADPGDADRAAPEDAAEYAAEYGYGMFTLVPVANSEIVDTDPNMIMVSSLSWAEQLQWSAALWGEPSPDDEPPTTQHITVVDGSDRGAENAGCRGWAERTYDAQAAGLPADDIAALTALIDDVRAAIDSHPRLSDLDARWAQCMTEAGHPGLAAVGDPEQALVAEMDAAAGAVRADDPQTHDALVNEAQAVVAEHEIALATADLQCRHEVGYEQRRLEVASELQREFVDAHGAELDAWREATIARRR